MVTNISFLPTMSMSNLRINEMVTKGKCLISALANSLKNWRVDIEDERVEYFDGLVD